MSLNIHESIIDKLDYFIKIHKVPNIIFHGQSGSGKRTILHNFISKIYGNNKEKIKNFVMSVNCAHGKGIKFIRDELKFFAKTHINSNDGDFFKSIILLNADKLTIDAQSVLRRCIELFNHNTRFFIIVEDKYKLLKPILSRFCEIYIPCNFKNVIVKSLNKDKTNTDIFNNLYKYNLNKTYNLLKYKNDRIETLKKDIIKNINNKKNINDLLKYCEKLYQKSYNALDIVKLLEEHSFLQNQLSLERRYDLLILFNKIKREFRCEHVLMFMLLYFIFIDNECNLENINFI